MEVWRLRRKSWIRVPNEGSAGAFSIEFNEAVRTAMSESLKTVIYEIALVLAYAVVIEAFKRGLPLLVSH
jgi:hypothetical protein